QCGAERTDHSRANQVRISQHQRMSPAFVIGLTYRQPVFAVVIAGIVEAGKFVTSEEGVLRGQLVVNLADYDVLVGVVYPAELHCAAGIGWSQEPLFREVNCGR